jgi:hypothetical protein
VRIRFDFEERRRRAGACRWKREKVAVPCAAIKDQLRFEHGHWNFQAGHFSFWRDFVDFEVLVIVATPGHVSFEENVLLSAATSMPNSNGRPSGCCRLKTGASVSGASMLRGNPRNATSRLVATREFGWFASQRPVWNSATGHFSKASGLAARPAGTSTLILFSGAPTGLRCPMPAGSELSSKLVIRTRDDPRPAYRRLPEDSRKYRFHGRRCMCPLRSVFLPRRKPPQRSTWGPELQLRAACKARNERRSSQRP